MELICPVCSRSLQAKAHYYICPKGHSFDRAKSGYVNLLQKQRHRQRGDDADMAKARRDFLNAGYYQPLLDAVASQAIAHRAARIADIGCGEGWYSCSMLRQLTEQGIDAALTGIDISPEILRFAAVRASKEGFAGQTDWAVASVNRLPLAGASCDCILNLFAPCDPSEFCRILKKGGLLLRVVPLERHLWELKQMIYDVPYENRPVCMAPEGFRLTGMQNITYRITVPHDHLHALFAMTPYAHKTSPSDAAKLTNAAQLETTVSFGLLCCIKV